MSATATVAVSAAILKTKYPDGRLPLAMYEKFPFVASIQKNEDFDGNNKVIALQTENPQGSSADFQTALGSLAQGNYSNFLLTRVEHFGIARIKGQAMKAAAKSTGALVDLWQRETDGINQTEMKALEIYLHGDGSGTLGSISSGSTVASLTITLANISDAPKFDLGMRLGAVSDSTLSPTVRPGWVTVTSIDRVGGTLTVTGSNWSTSIVGLATGDYLVRYGDNAVAGTGNVVTGVKQWCVGGTTPGTLFGLNRNTDPVRLAGQTYNATNVPMEDALIEAESLRNFQGQMGKLTGWVNSRDISQFKKSLGGKVQYTRVNSDTTIAGVSFRAIEFEGDFDTIKLMSSPFVSRNTVELLQMEDFSLDSLGPAPQMLDFDGPNFLRVGSDDAYEVRFGLYGNSACKLPSGSIIMTNWGN